MVTILKAEELLVVCLMCAQALDHSPTGKNSIFSKSLESVIEYLSNQ